MKENVSVFTTKNLAIRRFVSEDADLAYQFSKSLDPQQMPHDYFESVADARKRLDYVIANYAIQHYPIHYAIVMKKENRLIGSLAYKRMSDYHIRISIIIAEEYRRRGFATETASAAAEYGKRKLGLDEVYALVAVNDTAAVLTAEGAGFTLIGDSKEDIYPDHRPVSCYKI